jgi:hypothetical protein
LGDVLGREGGFEVVFRDPSGNVAAQLRSRGWVLDSNPDESSIICTSEGDAQRALDDIRGAGGVVVSYRAVTRSLEDVFLEGVAPRKEGRT